jgi:hypothetical protein
MAIKLFNLDNQKQVSSISLEEQMLDFNVSIQASIEEYNAIRDARLVHLVVSKLVSLEDESLEPIVSILKDRVGYSKQTSLEEFADDVSRATDIALEGAFTQGISEVFRLFKTQESLKEEYEKIKKDILDNGTIEGVLKDPSWGRYLSISDKGPITAKDIIDFYTSIKNESTSIPLPKLVKMSKELSDKVESFSQIVDDSSISDKKIKKDFDDLVSIAEDLLEELTHAEEKSAKITEKYNSLLLKNAKKKLEFKSPSRKEALKLLEIIDIKIDDNKEINSILRNVENVKSKVIGEKSKLVFPSISLVLMGLGTLYDKAIRVSYGPIDIIIITAATILHLKTLYTSIKSIISTIETKANKRLGIKNNKLSNTIKTIAEDSIWSINASYIEMLKLIFNVEYSCVKYLRASTP